MIDMNTTGASRRTVTAFFDSRDAAERAAGQLASLGVTRDRIRITDGDANRAATPREEKGFWEELKDLFLPDEDRYSYAEGLRRGGYLLSADVDANHYDRALEVLDTDGAVDMSQREAGWRESGWAGYPSQPSDAVAPSTAMNRAATPEARRSDAIPVYEETAKVGKRDVSHGRVRLRSYVVETPISEQVNLRNEKVQVERRPVDRPVAVGDAAFRDRTIEAEERVEAPVVSKQTRIKEEVGLRKTVENQTQTITDKVRRTEVEVQDERGRSTGAMAGGASRITDHMDVIASDGTRIGEVDHLEGDRIKLAKSSSPDGLHHFVPLAWVDHVDAHVHLSKSAAETRAGW